MKHGASPDVLREKFHDSPLHFAASSGRVAVIKTLLDAGANPHIVNAAGFLPLDLANEYQKEDCAELLRDPPYPPEAPTVIDITDIDARVMWTVPPDNGVVTDGYEVMAVPVSGSGILECVAETVRVIPQINNLPVEPRSDISYMITGLFTDTTYHISVRAKNSKGWSGFSETTEVHTGPSRPTEPGAPRVLHYTAIAATLDWKESLAHGSAIIGYELQWKALENYDDISWDERKDGATLGRLTTEANLELNVTYVVGDEIECRPANSEDWFSAFISKVGPSNTYTVRYEASGERESGVNVSNIKRRGDKQSIAAKKGLEVWTQ